MIGLIIGNGLAYDLRIFSRPKLDEWNPGKPFSWEYPPFIRFDPPEYFPELMNYVKTIQSINPMIDDFSVFETIGNDTNASKLSCEARHFLALSYSHFQLIVDKLDIKSWTWYKWIERNKADLGIVISFNYDLIIERLLFEARVMYYRMFVNSSGGVPIFKPHGSIDFDVSASAINIKNNYPLQNIVDLNNCQLRALNKSERFKPRIEADIVLPNESTKYRDYQWVKPGYNSLKLYANKLSECIFLGLSYNKFDIHELDEIIDCLNPRTNIIIANPKPDDEFIKKIHKKFSKIEFWNNGPPI